MTWRMDPLQVDQPLTEVRRHHIPTLFKRFQARPAGRIPSLLKQEEWYPKFISAGRSPEHAQRVASMGPGTLPELTIQPLTVLEKFWCQRLRRALTGSNPGSYPRQDLR